MNCKNHAFYVKVDGDRNFSFLNNSKFTKKVMQITASHVNGVLLSNKTKYLKLFFEVLSRNSKQKKLDIHYLKKVNDLVIEILHKLHE